MCEDEKLSVKNPEGYVDTTAYIALTNVLRQQQERDGPDQRHYRLIKTLLNAIDLMGYDLLNRIEVRDRDSGRVYR